MQIKFPNGLFCVILDPKRIVIRKASRVNVCLFSSVCVCHISDWILFVDSKGGRSLRLRKGPLTRMGVGGLVFSAAPRHLACDPNPQRSRSARSIPEVAGMFFGVIRAQCARAFASQIVVRQTTSLKGPFLSLPSSFATLKTSPDPDIYTS